MSLSDYYRSCAFPKGTPPTVERQEKKAAAKSAEDKCRDAVWHRDKSHSRASGKPLKRGGANPDTRGEWCHLAGRRVKPEWKLDPKRSLLMSATEHQLSDSRGGHLLKLLDPKTLKPATRADQPILFVRYEMDGRELWRRVG